MERLESTQRAAQIALEANGHRDVHRQLRTALGALSLVIHGASWWGCAG